MTDTTTDDAVRFTRPGSTSREADAAARAAVAREDEPPPDVPRDRHDQPLIVAPDGSGVVAYRRASKYGGIIEDTYGLNQWGKRTVAFGLSRAHHLIVRAQAVRTQTDPADVVALQDIADRADLIAGADAGAVTGTGLHRLSEYRDAGENLSYLDPVTAAALDAYTALSQPFEVLATELFVVCDDLQAAGTLDRVLRLRAPITWPDGVVWPAGMVVVIDVKTSKVSSAKYWGPGYTVQQWVYRTGVPYRAGTTVLRDPGKRSAANVEKVLDQPGDHGRLSWTDVGVPQAPSGMLILHIPAADPAAARWERVDPDVAHADAQAARAAWERHRVPRGQRFLALPADALPVAPRVSDTEAFTYTCTEHGRHDGVLCPGCIAEHRHAAAVSQQEAVVTTYADDADDVPDADMIERATLDFTAVLRERIARADTTNAVDALYDAWSHSPSWDATLTAECQAAYDRITSAGSVPADRCPSCGVPAGPGRDCCRRCELRILIIDAPDVDTLELLYAAHGPEGDRLWDDGEHGPPARARHAELTDGGPVVPHAPESYPVTVAGGVVLYCGECLGPDEDPAPWCGCRPGDDQCPGTCRQRAHAPADCPSRRRVGPGAAPGGDGVPDDPGPFDDTAALAALRTALREALDTETVDALYDVHKPVEQGGDGVWDDECTARAQAAYDRLSGRGAPS